MKQTINFLLKKKKEERSKWVKELHHGEWLEGFTFYHLQTFSHFFLLQGSESIDEPEKKPICKSPLDHMSLLQ